MSDQRVPLGFVSLKCPKQIFAALLMDEAKLMSRQRQVSAEKVTLRTTGLAGNLVVNGNSNGAYQQWTPYGTRDTKEGRISCLSTTGAASSPVRRAK